MRTVEEHLGAVLAAVGPLPPQRVGLPQAYGLVAAADVLSRVDLPGFDNSAMDGYAVHAADVAAASGSAPVRLVVVDDIPAGSAPSCAVEAGQASRIMTGSMMPQGADAVVPVEDTDAGTQIVQVRAPAAPGEHVRRQGEDLPAGGPVLPAGAVLDARRVALAAAAGHADLLVHPRARVAVVSTGAELVEPGRRLAPGQIYDSNSHLLAAAVARTGGVTAYRSCVGDDPHTLRALLDRLVEQVDVVVTSGGVSMGAYDVVKQVLQGPGGVQFDPVAMQPGKPQGFGVLGPAGVAMFALPGNPVSAYVSFEVFVRPALRTMMGLSPAVRPTVRARLATPLRSPPGRRQYARAVADLTRAVAALGCGVTAYPGENEMQALARGALRVLRGREVARQYDPRPQDTGPEAKP